MCDLDIEPNWHMRFDLYVWPWTNLVATCTMHII